jgi:DNA-binding transcriptional LysR family regulator
MARPVPRAERADRADVPTWEAELEVRLFDRPGRGILLTEAGERLLPYARKMLDLSEEARSHISGAAIPTGNLTIRVPESMAVWRLPRVIARFHEQFPKVRLTFTTCAHDGLQKDLRKGVTDLAFLLVEGIQAGDLESEILGFENIVMVAAPHHPLAGKSILTLEDLAGQSLLLSKVDCSYRRILEATLKQEEIQVEKIVTFHSVTALKACVMAGLGVTILPESAVAHDAERQKLVRLPCEEGTFEVAILMIWYREKWLSPALQAFMKMAKDAMKEDQ